MWLRVGIITWCVVRRVWKAKECVLSQSASEGRDRRWSRGQPKLGPQREREREKSPVEKTTGWVATSCLYVPVEGFEVCQPMFNDVEPKCRRQIPARRGRQVAQTSHPEVSHRYRRIIDVAGQAATPTEEPRPGRVEPGRHVKVPADCLSSHRLPVESRDGLGIREGARNRNAEDALRCLR